jgi:CHAD domain-containing protein
MPRPHAASADRATPLLRARVRALFRHLPKALGGNEEEIHQMRVAGRRLRVALPLLARRPHGRRVRRALSILRDLTRAGGVSRDLDVGLSLLEERLKSAEASRERGLLLRRFRSARTRSRSTMAESLLDLNIAKLRRHLRVVVGRRAEGVFSVILRLREVREGFGAFVEDLRLETGRYDPEALHRLRRRTRRLRYSVEVSDAIRGQESEGPALMKRLQDLLGLSHDAHVLAGWLARQASSADASGNAALAEEARSLEAFFRERSHEHHRAFAEADPPALARRAIEGLGPAPDAATKPGGFECAS